MKTELKSLIRSTVQDCRKILFEETREQLAGIYGLDTAGTFESPENLPGLSENPEQTNIRRELEEWIAGEVRSGLTPPEAVQKLIRETAFTHLNRLAALKMMETRKLMRGTIDKGIESNGFKFYLAEHPDTLKRYESGEKELAYQQFLNATYRNIAEKDHLEVLFNPDTLTSRLFPRPRILAQILALLNLPELQPAWHEDETIGWVYQYFIEQDKDRVFHKIYKEKQKMALREIPHATQIFTPRWIVRYLVENTLGRLWLRMHPDTALANEMRYYVPNPYNDAEPLPAKPVKDITLLDPACGTMHFGLVAFDLFHKMYLEELRNAGKPGWTSQPSVATESDIPAAILENNIYGIDIDLRAIQLSALTLYLKAKTANPALHIRKLNLTYTDIPVISPANQQQFISNLPIRQPLAKELLGKILPDLNKAYYLGSLLKIEETVQAFIDQKRGEQDKFPLLKALDTENQPDFWQQIREEILHGLREYVAHSTNGNRLIAGESIQVLGLIDALLKKHDVVVANPPYSGSRNWSSQLKTDLKGLYPKKDGDLYSIFIDRALNLTAKDGFTGLVTVHTFMFTSSYETIRQVIMESTAISTMVHLGTRAEFDVANKTAQGFTAYTLNKQDSVDAESLRGIFFRLVSENETDKHTAFEKALQDWQTNRETATDSHIYVLKQSDFKAIPGMPLVYWISDKVRRLFVNNNPFSNSADTCQGIATADNTRFLREWWEIGNSRMHQNCLSHEESKQSHYRWFPYMKGGDFNRWYGNIEFTVNWRSDGYEIKNFYRNGRLASRPQNIQYFFREGGTYSFMTTGALSIRYLPIGFGFDVIGSSIFPKSCNAKFIAGFLNSKIVYYLISILNPTVAFQVGDIARLPFPDVDNRPQLKQRVENDAQQCIHIKHTYAFADPLSWECLVPANWHGHFHAVLAAEKQLALLESRISRTVYELFGIGEADIQQIETELGALPDRMPNLQNPAEKELKAAIRSVKTYYLEKHIPEEALKTTEDTLSDEDDGDGETGKSRRQKRYLTFEEVCLASGYHPETVHRIITEANWERPEERFDLALHWLEYALGILMGRFSPGTKGALGSAIIHKNDFITGSLTITDDEFAEITRYFPVAYTDEDGKHAFSKATEEQLRSLADPDGIMVLDMGHADDLPARIEEVLTIMLGEHYAHQVLATLIGQKLPDTAKFRKFMERDFFGKHHVKLYKKRPIYWLLQTAAKSYGFYIFHERMDSDTLHKLMRNYIDPKLKHIEDELRDINNRLKGLDGKDYRDLAKERDTMEELLQEIREFAEQVTKIIEMKDDIGKLVGYNPDINDGVILNMAPLYSLIPWKEPQKYWEELQEGKYDWAHIAMRYWSQRVLDKCAGDKSLAIAHGLDG